MLTNPTAGTQGIANLKAIEQATQQAGLDCEVRAIQGFDLQNAARSAHESGIQLLIAAGGDGTVSAVAGALAGTSAILGILPSGTLNHFARDLGIPTDLHAAARIIAGGHVRVVDIGEVNGRFFVNNSSIGLYPRIVMRRREQCVRLGRGKWLAMGLAIITIFRRYPLVRVELQTEKGKVDCKTPFVFIGNNRYDIDLLSLGGRKQLDAGELSLYFTSRTGRFGLLVLMGRMLLGRLKQARDFNASAVREVKITTEKKLLRVACDGEVLRLTSPLHYRIHPGALRVLAPIR